MAQGDLRLEVFTRPGANPFERKDIAPPGPFSATKRMAGGIGRGQLTVPVNYGRINELIRRTPGDPGTDIRRLARVYAEGVTLPVYEFFLDNTSDEAVETDLTISGAGVESLLADGIVEAWDWDGSDVSESTFPDWIWGGREVVGPVETSFAPHIFTMWTDAASGSFQIGVSLNGGAFEYATVTVGDTAFVVEQAIEALGTVDTADVEGTGTATNPWQVKILSPSGTYTVALGSNSLVGGRAYITLDQFGKLLPTGWTESRVGSTTIPHGVITDFRASLGGGSDPVLPVECSAWVVFLGQEYLFPGVQKIVKVTPGGVFQAPSLYLFAQGASAFLRVVIRDLNENLIAKEEITVPSNTLTSTVGMVNVQIPEGVTEVVFRIGHIGAGTPPRIFVACPSFREGLAPTSAGGIFEALFTDATVSHVFDGRVAWENLASPGTTYLDLSFTSAVDSAGVVWDNPAMDFTAKRGKNHQQVLQDLAHRGYRWSVTPSNTEGRWRVNLYNPTWVKVDATALDSPAINVGSGVTSGPIVRSHLTGNAITVEGDQMKFARSLSATSIAAIGRREIYQPDRTITTTDAANIRAAQEVASRLLSGLSVALNIDPVNSPIPLVDYDVDWQVNVQVPPALPKSAHRVAAITFNVAAGTKYSVSFSSESFTGPAGVVEGTRRLLEKYEGFEREAPDNFPTPITGGGGMATVLVAAVDATQYSIDKADFLCTGVNDHDVIQQACDSLQASHGTVWLSEGTFFFDVLSGSAVTVPAGCTIRGLGAAEQFNVTTYIEANVNTPAAMSSMFSLGNGCAMMDLQIDANQGGLLRCLFIDGSVASKRGIRLERLHLIGDKGALIHGVRSFSLWLNNLTLYNFATEDAILLDSCNEVRVVGCQIEYGNRGVRIIDTGGAISAGTTEIIGLRVWGTERESLYIDTASYVNVTGGILIGSSGLDTTPGVRISNCSQGVVKIVGTIVQGTEGEGILIQDSSLIELVGVSIETTDREGIKLDNAQQCVIADSTVRFAGGLTDNTYAGILIDGDSDLNRVQNCTSRAGVMGIGNDPRYGLHVATGATDNIVDGNDLRNGGQTANYQNDGTGTLGTNFT